MKFQIDTDYLPALHLPKLPKLLQAFRQENDGQSGITVLFVIRSINSGEGPERGLLWTAKVLALPHFLERYLPEFPVPAGGGDTVTVAERAATSELELLLELDSMIPKSLWPCMTQYLMAQEEQVALDFLQDLARTIPEATTDFVPLGRHSLKTKEN